MTKKELLNRIEEIEELVEINFGCLDKRVNNLKSEFGQIPNRIEESIKIVKENLAFNANLMNLLMEHLNLGFYEIPTQKSKIEIRKKEKISTNNSKRKSRPSTSRVGKKNL